ncbi:hypothetical protein [Biformimicrobium ophioploci]|uniref:Periplasmic heavy metal sensor n=1 Tax=Biformimicrobium ophioploci TaxID=3036711 RepID=A0ABQ6LZ26_9GAMM|nr:hypothetical protein [Microbulbifer sp. NKW57]GMG87343.1 hypothetical protein MNKW57_16640 [Microbulbifer sp. NKW57]
MWQVMRKGGYLALALVVLLLAAGQVSADAHKKKGLGADFWEKYADITDWMTLEMKLTPEQEKKVLPMLQDSFKSKVQVLKDYGFEVGKKPELSCEQILEIDEKILKVRVETVKKVKPELSEEQVQSYIDIVRGFHMDMKERLLDLEKGH